LALRPLTTRAREKYPVQSSTESRPDRRNLYRLTGIRGETVTDVSQRLLAHHGGLRGLFRLDVAELARVRGLGDAKAVRLKAALELGRPLTAPWPQPLVHFPEARGAPTCAVIMTA
jgi:DNA repair protein RadC